MEKEEAEKLWIHGNIFPLLSRADCSLLSYNFFGGYRFVLGDAMPNLFLSSNNDFFLFLI